MLSNEHSRSAHFWHEQYTSETDNMNSYQTNTMESFDFNTNGTFNMVSYPWNENSTTYLETSNNNGYEMMRTASNGTSRSLYEVPPSLQPSSHSADSASSSTVGSPYSGYAQIVPSYSHYSTAAPSYIVPTIVGDDGYQLDSHASHQTELAFTDKFTSVDPSLISGIRDSTNFNQYNITPTFQQSQAAVSPYSAAPSPAPSSGSSYHVFNPPVTSDSFKPHNKLQRRGSISSQRSSNSPRPSVSSDDENGEKGRCQYPDCGKVFKDLKAHLLTHQNERPEKCPIVNCEYYLKGFARKYDKNRHTLTHYKGTMICGFCPGSGSPAEKSFNRADVFKRHLTSVHGVEQAAPNSKRKSPNNVVRALSSYCPDATGKCSTCSSTFSNAQDFYEHLDDCVLRVVQQEDPCEAINETNLADIDMDPAVKDTFERHMIKTEYEFNPLADEDEDDEEMDDDEDDDEVSNDRPSQALLKATKAAGARVVIGGAIVKNTKSNKRGMTWSKGGVAVACKGRKRRKHYPPSWGLSAEKMGVKKRVLCVYDGSRRLLKDDMMLYSQHEVRMSLPSGNNYVTDLDVETVKRANAFHDATDEEKGEWIPEQDFLSDLMG